MNRRNFLKNSAVAVTTTALLAPTAAKSDGIRITAEACYSPGYCELADRIGLKVYIDGVESIGIAADESLGMVIQEDIYGNDIEIYGDVRIEVDGQPVAQWLASQSPYEQKRLLAERVTRRWIDPDKHEAAMKILRSNGLLNEFWNAQHES